MDVPDEQPGTFLRYLVKEKRFVRVHQRRKSHSKPKKAKDKESDEIDKSALSVSSVEEQILEVAGVSQEGSLSIVKHHIATSIEENADVTSPKQSHKNSSSNDVEAKSDCAKKCVKTKTGDKSVRRISAEVSCYADVSDVGSHQKSLLAPLKEPEEVHKPKNKHRKSLCGDLDSVTGQPSLDDVPSSIPLSHTDACSKTQHPLESSAKITTHVKTLHKRYKKSLSVDSGTKFVDGKTEAKITEKTNIGERRFRKASSDDLKNTDLIAAVLCYQGKQKQLSSCTRKTEDVERSQTTSKEVVSNTSSVNHKESVSNAKPLHECVSNKKADMKTERKPPKAPSENLETNSFSEKMKSQAKSGERSLRKTSCDDILEHACVDNNGSARETRDVRTYRKECGKVLSEDQETQSISGKTSFDISNSTGTSMTSQAIHHPESFSKDSEDVKAVHNQHRKSVCDDSKAKSVEETTDSKDTPQCSAGERRLRKASDGSGDGNWGIQQQNAHFERSQRRSSDASKSSNGHCPSKVKDLLKSSVNETNDVTVSYAQTGKSECEGTEADFVSGNKNAESHQTKQCAKSVIKTSTDDVESSDMNTVHTGSSKTESNVAKDEKNIKSSKGLFDKEESENQPSDTDKSVNVSSVLEKLYPKSVQLEKHGHSDSLATSLTTVHRSESRMTDNCGSFSNRKSICHSRQENSLDHSEHDGKANESKAISRDITSKRESIDRERNAQRKISESPRKHGDRNAIFREQDSRIRNNEFRILSKERDTVRESSYSPRRNTDRNVIPRERDFKTKEHDWNVCRKERDSPRKKCSVESKERDSPRRNSDLRNFLKERDRQRRYSDLSDLSKERGCERRNIDLRDILKERDRQRRYSDFSDLSQERDGESRNRGLIGVSRERDHERRNRDLSVVFKERDPQRESKDSPRKHSDRNVTFREPYLQRQKCDRNVISKAKESDYRKSSDCQKESRDRKYIRVERESKGFKSDRKDSQGSVTKVQKERESKRESGDRKVISSQRSSDFSVTSKDRESPKNDLNFESKEEDSQRVTTERKNNSDERDLQRNDSERKTVTIKRKSQKASVHAKVMPKEREFKRKSVGRKVLPKERDTPRESDDREVLLEERDAQRESDDDREILPIEGDSQRESDDRNVVSEETNRLSENRDRNVMSMNRDTQIKSSDMRPSGPCTRSDRNDENVSDFQIVNKSELHTSPKQDSGQEKGNVKERSGQAIKLDIKVIRSFPSPKKCADIQQSTSGANHDTKSSWQNETSTPGENMVEEPIFQVCRRLNLETGDHSSFKHNNISCGECENQIVKHYKPNPTTGERHSDKDEIIVKKRLIVEGYSLKTCAQKEPRLGTSTNMISQPSKPHNSGCGMDQNCKNFNCQKKKELHKKSLSSGRVKKRRSSKLKLFLKILVTATSHVLSSDDMRSTMTTAVKKPTATQTQDLVSRKQSLNIQEEEVKSSNTAVEFCDETQLTGSLSTCNIQEEKIPETSEDSSFKGCVETTRASSKNTYFGNLLKEKIPEIPKDSSIDTRFTHCLSTYLGNTRIKKQLEDSRDSLFERHVETRLTGSTSSWSGKLQEEKNPKTHEDSSYERRVDSRFTHSLNTCIDNLQKKERLENSRDSSCERRVETIQTRSNSPSNLQEGKIAEIPEDSSCGRHVETTLTDSTSTCSSNLQEEKMTETPEDSTYEESVDTRLTNNLTTCLGNKQEEKKPEISKNSSFEESVESSLIGVSTIYSGNLQEDKILKVSRESSFEGCVGTRLMYGSSICSQNLQEEKIPETSKDSSFEGSDDTGLKHNSSTCSDNLQEKINLGFSRDGSFEGNIETGLNYSLNIRSDNLQEDKIAELSTHTPFQHKTVPKTVNVFRIEDESDKPLDLTVKKCGNNVLLEEITVTKSAIQPITKHQTDNGVGHGDKEKSTSVFEEANINQYEWISSEDNSQSSQAGSQFGNSGVPNPYMTKIHNNAGDGHHEAVGLGNSESSACTESKDIVPKVSTKLQLVDLPTGTSDTYPAILRHSENEPQSYRDSFEWISEEGSQDRVFIEEPSNAETQLSDVKINPAQQSLDPNSSYEWISDEDGDVSFPLLSSEEENEMKNKFDWKSGYVAPASSKRKKSEFKLSVVDKDEQNCEGECANVVEKKDLEKAAEEKEPMNIFSGNRDNEIMTSDSDSDEDLPTYLYKDNDVSTNGNLQDKPDSSYHEDRLSSASVCTMSQKLHEDSVLQTNSEIESSASKLIPLEDVLKGNIKSEPKEDELDISNIKIEPPDDQEHSTGVQGNSLYGNETTNNTVIKTEQFDEDDPQNGYGGESLCSSTLVSNIKKETCSVESSSEQQPLETRDAVLNNENDCVETLRSDTPPSCEHSVTREELVDDVEMLGNVTNSISSENSEISGPTSASKRELKKDEHKRFGITQSTSDSTHQQSSLSTAEKTHSSRHRKDKKQSVSADHNKGKNKKHCSTKSTEHHSIAVKSSKQQKESLSSSVSCLTDAQALKLDTSQVIDGRKNRELQPEYSSSDYTISDCMDVVAGGSESNSGALTFAEQTTEAQRADQVAESCDTDQIVRETDSPDSNSRKLDISSSLSVDKFSGVVAGAGSIKESHCSDESEISRTCSCCGKILQSQYALRGHMRIHGDRPYKCIVCEKDFYCNNNLQQHMLVHIGGKLTKCKVCNKIFFRENSLKIHMLKHTLTEINECAERKEETSGMEDNPYDSTDATHTVRHESSKPKDNFRVTAELSEDVGDFHGEISPVVTSGDARSCTVSSSDEADSTTASVTKSERVSGVTDSMLTRTKNCAASTSTNSGSKSRHLSDHMSRSTHPCDTKSRPRHVSSPSTVSSSILEDLPNTAKSGFSHLIKTEDADTCSVTVETVQNTLAISNYVKSEGDKKWEFWNMGMQSDEESCESSNCEDCFIVSCELKSQNVAKHIPSESVTADIPEDRGSEISTTDIGSLDSPLGTNRVNRLRDESEIKENTLDAESKPITDPHQETFSVAKATVAVGDSGENVHTNIKSDTLSEDDHENFQNISYDSNDSCATLMTDSTSGDTSSLKSTHTSDFVQATKIKKSHECTVCGKTFQNVVTLTKHITLHGEKKHKCEVCYKDFHSVAYLRKHMNVHTGNRVKCEICQKLLSCPAKLKYHMVIHTGERRHKCTYCGECFTLGSELTAHEVLHLASSDSGTTSDVQDSPAVKKESVDKNEDATSNMDKSTTNEENVEHTTVLNVIKVEITTADNLNAERIPVTLTNINSDPSDQESSVILSDELLKRAIEDLSEQEYIVKSELPSDELLEIANKDSREQESVVKTEILSDETLEKLNKDSKDEKLTNWNEASDTNSVVETNVKKSASNKSKTNHTTAVSKVDSSDCNQSCTCNVCGKVFSSSNARSRHMKIHNERTYKCEICAKAFYSTSNLSQHMIVHTGGNPAKCKICNKMLSCAAKMKVHMRSHTKEKPYGCSDCGKCFSVWSSLKLHRLTHSNMSIKCKVCGQIFRDPKLLERHMKTHGERKFKCEFCGKPFKRPSHLKNHNVTIHVKQKNYRCYICAAPFPEGEALQQHLSLHTDFKCVVCAQHFTSFEHLREHLRTHPGFKPFKCDICDKSFSQEGTFNIHKRVHTGERPFPCLICGKSFTQATHLKTHQRVHKEKTVECDNCDRKFLGIKELQEHMETHSDDKTYECRTCKCRFFSERSLKRHKEDFCKKTVKPFQCDDCQCRFSTAATLREHKKRHALKGVFPCDLCNKIFPMLFKLQKHKKVIHVVGHYNCLLCDSIFQTSELHDSHMNEHKTDSGFQCSKCTDVIPALNDLKKHMKKHVKQGRAKPNNFSESDSSMLVDHKAKKQKLSCEGFNENEPQRSRDEVNGSTSPSLTSNLNKRGYQSSDRPAYNCKKCGKEYSKENHLQRHVSMRHDKTDNGKPVFPGTRQDVDESSSMSTKVKLDNKMTQKKTSTIPTSSDKTFAEKNCDNGKRHKNKYRASVKTSHEKQTEDLKSVNTENNQTLCTSKSSYGIETKQSQASKSSPKDEHKQILPSSQSKVYSAHNKPHKCEVCIKTYDDSDHLRRHLKKHKKYVTSHEKGKSSEVEGTDTNEALEISRLSQKDETIPILSPSKIVKNTSKSHLSLESQRPFLSPMEDEAKKFKCEVCKKSYVNSDDLKRHMKKHSKGCEEKQQNESSGLKESTCKKECFLPRDDERKKANHTLPISSPSIADEGGLDIFKCNVCQKGYHDSDHLLRHMKKHQKHVNTHKSHEKQETDTSVSPSNSPTKPSVEDKIGQTSSSMSSCVKNALPSTSKKGNTDVKPFKCELCKRSYSNSVHLEKHRKKHKTKEVSCETVKNIKRKHSESEQQEISPTKKLKDESDKDDKLSSQSLNVGKKFSCNVCSKSYSDPGFLRHHLRKHSDDSKKCEQCGRAFADESHLRQHQKKHHNDHLNETRETKPNTVKRQHKCDVCDKTLTSKSSLNEHTLIHTGERPYKCKICPNAFGDRRSLDAHLKRHTGVRSHHCEVCPKKFYEATSLRAHMRVHSGELPFKCPVCGKGCSEQGSLQKHLKKHTGYKPHMCDVCGRPFAEMSAMKLHRMTHESERPYKCEECEKGFIIKEHLNVHMRTHTGERPFKCEVCGKAFTTKGNLTAHVVTHSNERKFKCELCKATFKTSGSLLCHEKIHKGVKAFKCGICGKSFLFSSSLRVHTATHSDEKPFKCEHCNSSFKDKRNLMKHKIIHTERGREFVCEICNEGFYNRSVLKNHKKTHSESGSHKCMVCGVFLRSSSSLKMHMRVHNNEFPFTCKTCGKKFRQLSNMRTHMHSHSSVKQFKCTICEKEYTLPHSLKAHMKEHRGEKRKVYECPICHKKLRGGLNSHLKIHGNEKPFKCSLCGDAFIRRDSLRSHMRVHTGEKAFQCDVCKKCFSQKSALVTHKRYHTGERPYKCKQCNKSFTQASHLRTHEKGVHLKIKNQKCQICEKSFNSAAYLRSHMMIHTGEKPLQCKMCGKRFSRPNSLKSHMLVHTGVKKFKCDVCGKAFTHSGTLKCHMRYHTGEKPYACDQCDAAFPRSDSLKFHKLSHTGERPFSCEMCDNTFKTANCLKSHMSSHTDSSFPCDVCGKILASKSNLKSHQELHKENVFSCDQCNKTFATESRLKKHKEFCNTEKKFECKICGKKLSRLETLKSHMEIHEDIVKKFECVQCGKKFRQSKGLKAHMFTHNPEELKHKCEKCGKRFSLVTGLKKHEQSHLDDLPFHCQYCEKGFAQKSNMKKHIELHHEEEEEEKMDTEDEKEDTDAEEDEEEYSEHSEQSESGEKSDDSD